MTFSSVQTRVLANIIDLPSQVVTAVPTLVNAAYRKLQRKHNFKIMEAELTATTNRLASDAGRVLVAIPSTFKEPRDRPWYTENLTGATRRLTIATSRESIWRAIDLLDIGRPRVLLDALPDVTLARNYEVYPLPDGFSDYADGEYRITIPYWSYLPVLVAGSDTTWLLDNAEEYVVDYATARGFLMNWDEEHTAVWEKLAQAEFDEVLKLDKYYRLAGVRELVPQWQGANSPRLRW